MLRLTTLVAIAFAVSGASAQAQRRTPLRATPDYSSFSHTTHVGKDKLACISCHKFPSKNWKEVRKGDAAFPDLAEFPEHASCLNCHRQQFFARERPAPRICSNCHVKATPIDTSRYAFPSLGEAFLSTAKAVNFVSEFSVLFPHDKHADSECVDCHKPYEKDAKGTFQTRPFTHASCFTCHNQESELAPLPQNCDACHKPRGVERTTADFDQKLAGTVKDWWASTAQRNRISAGAFRHEPHTDLKCMQCHNVTAMNTTNDETRSVPVKSCGGGESCHVTATLDDGGILNYELDQRKKSATFGCTKCHLAFGSKPVPATHLDAIQKSPVKEGERILFAHAAPQAATTDFSQFKHDNRNHARLPCLLCHRRENNSPQPTLPGKAAHAPCTGCHAQQFSNSGSAICTICHTDVQSGKVKPFPPLRSFDVRFDHAKHTSAGCVTCHRASRGGVAFSIPARLNAHVTCFGCHTPNAQANGLNISSCSTCHQLGRFIRTSEQRQAYRVGFSHARHDTSDKLACAACHHVRAGLPLGRQVSAPSPLNHHAFGSTFSCATCHNGQRAFGGDDFAACKRCHTGAAWHF